MYFKRYCEYEHSHHFEILYRGQCHTRCISSFDTVEILLYSIFNRTDSALPIRCFQLLAVFHPFGTASTRSTKVVSTCAAYSEQNAYLDHVCTAYMLRSPLAAEVTHGWYHEWESEHTGHLE